MKVYHEFNEAFPWTKLDKQLLYIRAVPCDRNEKGRPGRYQIEAIDLKSGTEYILAEVFYDYAE